MTRRIKFNSIETRLIVVLIFVAILPAITVGLIARNMMSSYIRSERIKEVGQVADSKHSQLVMVLTRANDRAESFLSNLITQCSGNPAKLNHNCAADLIRSYLGAEGALGATLRRKGGGDSLTIGTSAVQNEENITFQTGQIAKFSGTGPENNRSYFISVTEKSTGFLLGITYPSSILEPVFDAPADLGHSGETFLADGEGYFVTKHKYPSTQGNSHPISARPMQSCLSGQLREVLDLDYRDAAIIHGFRFVPEFGSSCIMAHIDQDEAFAPLNLLENRLIITIFVFVVILIIITVYLAKNIVKPITKLTKVANTIAAGDYTAQAEVKGSNEISELASSFNFMTNQLLQEEARLRNAMAENLSLQAQMLHGQKLESLGVMAGSIAHDFNNLLMSMMGNTELALINLSEGSPARESIEKIKEVVQRAAELTKQMLAYSGRGKFVIENINLSGVVEDMAELLKVSIEKNVTIKYQLDHNLPQVEADATQIRQVAMNLIINAADAIGEKPGVVTVTTGLMECDSECLMDTVIGKEDLQTGMYVYLEVSDNGCGMDEKTLARIFDPFFTTKFTGRGLGLATVLGIVRGHKGALKVLSKPGEGTTFRVVLPKSDKHIEASPVANKQADDWRGRGTILVVDDEVDILTITRMMLEGKGFSVLTASNGAAGVGLFRKHSDEITAVLLDMTMPNMNGEEAFREMKKIRSDVLAVLVSGYNEEEIIARFSGESFAGFLHKPYGIPDLMNKLKEILP